MGSEAQFLVLHKHFPNVTNRCALLRKPTPRSAFTA
jgi:hypothetical protein